MKLINKNNFRNIYIIIIALLLSTWFYGSFQSQKQPIVGAQDVDERELRTANPTKLIQAHDGKKEFFIGCGVRPAGCERIELGSERDNFVFMPRGFRMMPLPNEAQFREEKLRPRYSALRQFNSVEKCLPLAETSKGRIDLSKVDWNKYHDQYDAEVCLSRMIWQIGSVEKVVTWLRRLGFTASVIIQNESRFFPEKALISPRWASDTPSPFAWGLLELFPQKIFTFGVLSPLRMYLTLEIRTRDTAVIAANFSPNYL